MRGYGARSSVALEGVLQVGRIVTPVGGVVAGGASVICMASMGAMAVASTAGAAAGMAGMGAAAASTPHTPAVTHALQAVGLGGLTHLSNTVLQPLLIALLLIAMGTALWRAWVTRTWPTAALTLVTVAAAAGLYTSIYLVVSETGYWIALVALLLTSAISGGRGGAPRLT